MTSNQRRHLPGLQQSIVAEVSADRDPHGESCMITADTITDEQIRSFGKQWEQVAADCQGCFGAGAFIHARKGDAPCLVCLKPRNRAGLASLALGISLVPGLRVSGLVQSAARGRCAEIINARAKETTSWISPRR